MTKKNMTIMTKDGVAGPMPLSDAQRFDKAVRIMNKFLYLAWAVFLFVVFMIFYIIYNNVLGNTLKVFI